MLNPTRLRIPQRLSAMLLCGVLLAAGCSGSAEDNTIIGGEPVEATTDTGGSASGSEGSAETAIGDATDEDDASVTATFDTQTTDSATPSSTLDPVFESGFCQASQRNVFEIKFRPGAVSSEVDSATIPGQVDIYEIEVNADQIMTITLQSANPDAVATLYRPDGTTQPGAFIDSTVAPTQAGSYWICVTSGSSGADYQLSTSVIDDRTPTKIDKPWCGDQVNDRGEIRFLPDRYAAEVENAVVRGERDLYRIGANEGQQIDLLLTSLESNAVFDLWSPSGEILIDEVSDFRLPLPESGTYEICVGSTRGNATYTLAVDIG
ncbi:MAG: hypothetical protein ACRBK7_02130 [Acidimicrobiales bacterium]